MKKYYENSWHGIPFSDVASLDTEKVAGAAFYEAFYKEFFNRYRNWSSLDPGWVGYKLKVAELILSRIPDQKAPILSAGCGLGFVEKHLIESGLSGLDVNETSVAPLQWLRPLIGESRIHLGRVPDCLPRGKLYDLAYLSAVDYCFDSEALQAYLGGIRSRLARGGRCLVVSGSFDPGGLVRYAKYLVRRALDSLGVLRHRGQLWGYLRTRAEYRTIMRAANFVQIEDGLLGNGVYWIEGRRNE